MGGASRMRGSDIRSRGLFGARAAQQTGSKRLNAVPAAHRPNCHMACVSSRAPPRRSSCQACRRSVVTARQGAPVSSRSGLPL